MAMRYTLTCLLVAMLTWGAAAASGVQDDGPLPPIASSPSQPAQSGGSPQSKVAQKSVDDLLQEKLAVCRELANFARQVQELGWADQQMAGANSAIAGEVEAEIEVMKSADARKLIAARQKMVALARQQEELLTAMTQVGRETSPGAALQARLARIDAEIALAKLMANYVQVALDADFSGGDGAAPAQDPPMLRLVPGPPDDLPPGEDNVPLPGGK